MDNRSPWRGRRPKKGNRTSAKAESQENFVKFFLQCFELEFGRAHHVPKYIDPELPTPGRFLE